MYVGRLVQPDAAALLEVQLFSEALRNARVRETVRKAWDDVVTRFEEIVRRGQAHGEIDPALEPNAVGRLLGGAYVGLLVQKTIDSDVDVWKYAEVLKALYSGKFWRGGGPASVGTS
jgi:hypothetical protein